MLLTALCVLYDSGGRLPEDRYQLYRRIVDNVLFHRFRDEVREREPARARLEAIALGMHEGETESPRLSPEAEISYLDIERLLRAFAAEDSSYERGRVEPVAQREDLLTRSGLLLPRPSDRAAFYHLSVQEFLAAERMLRTRDDLMPVFRERGAVAEWRPTLLFLFAGKIAAKTPRWGRGSEVRPAPLFSMRPTAGPRVAEPCGRDAPAPSFRPRLGPQTVVGGQLRKSIGTRRAGPARPQRPMGISPKREQKDVRQTHHTKPDVVIPVVRVVLVAVGRARVVLIVVPGPAAQHTGIRSTGGPTGVPTGTDEDIPTRTGLPAAEK
jgi:hypothetical protein